VAEVSKDAKVAGIEIIAATFAAFAFWLKKVPKLFLKK